MSTEPETLDAPAVDDETLEVADEPTSLDELATEVEEATEDESPTAVALLPRRHLALGAFIFAAAILLIDQLTKWWALTELTIGHPQRPVIGEFITFRLVKNPGAALGMGSGYTWVLTIIVVGVVAVVIGLMRKIRSRAWAFTLGALLGGALGNLIDRLVGRAAGGEHTGGFGQGAVVDFIGYSNWFTGNVADIAIVLASIALAVLAFVGIGLDGTRHSEMQSKARIAARQAARAEKAATSTTAPPPSSGASESPDPEADDDDDDVTAALIATFQ
ncbi:MAG: signal peptidase II [Promicromonosporaceae bacterium]|nr:signal peptidase II [Promicromonosporaceae bacterium]